MLGVDDFHMAQGKQGRANDCTIGLDGATFDLSNLTSQIVTISTAEARNRDGGPNLEKKKRPERGMMKLYPTGSSVRRKAPSIRDIDSFFGEKQSEETAQQGFSCAPDHGHGSTIGNSHTQHNNSWTENIDRAFEDARTNGGWAHQERDFDTLCASGQNTFRAALEQNVAEPANQQQYPSLDCNSPSVLPKSSQCPPQSHRGEKEPPRKLTPEEEARRMMEERFNRADDNVFQQFTRIAQKPETRVASRPAPANAKADDSSEFQGQDGQATSRRGSLFRKYSSRLNLKPSAKPEFESFEIEVSPGAYLPMRGAGETEDAVRNGEIRSMNCFCCETPLCFIVTAEYIFCPVCSVIGPIEFPSKGAHGVGLGLTEQMVNEIVREGQI